MYMLRTAGQTAEPIGLKFFVDTHGWPGVVISLKKILNFIFQIFFHIFILFQKIFPWATPGPSASNYSTV